MKTNFNLTAISMAVLTMLSLSACGGTTSVINGTGSIFDKQPTTTPTAPTTETPAAPTTETPAETTQPEVSLVDGKKPEFAENEQDRINPHYNLGAADTTLPHKGTTNLVRGNLHDDLKKAYGDQLYTTFQYKATVTQSDSAAKDKAFLAATDLDYKVFSQKQGTATGSQNPDDYNYGFSSHTIQEGATARVDGKDYVGARTNKIKLYQQENSIVLGRQTLSGKLSDGTTTKQIEQGKLQINTIQGKAFKPASNEEYKALQDAIDEAQKAKDEAESAVGKAEQAQKEAENAQKDAQEKLTKAQPKFDAAQKRLDSAQKLLDEANNKLLEAQEEAAKEAALKQLEIAQKSFESINAVYEKEKAPYDEALQAKTQAQSAIAEASKNVMEAQKTLSEAESSLAEAKNAMAEAKTPYNTWARPVDVAFVKNLGLRDEYLDESKQNKIFNYEGKAFNEKSEGDLKYQINFNTRTGQGEITQLDTGKIILDTANIGTTSYTNQDEKQMSTLGIQGVAKFEDKRDNGIYTLGIFGKEATEIAGVVSEKDVNTVGFGGIKVSEEDPTIPTTP